MSRNPAVVHLRTPVSVAVDLMRTRKIRHLPVVDDADRLVGIVTDRDLRQVVLESWRRGGLGDTEVSAQDLTVRDVMTWGVVSVAEDADLRAAARLMRERKIGALPVVAQGRVVGILTETDVLAALEQVLGDRVATIDPFPDQAGAGEPYDYGFPRPEDAVSSNEGIVD